jgi:hypothetical protein
MPPPDPKQSNYRIIAEIFRPVARFCIRHSVHLAEIVEVLKKVFVEEARDELQRTGELESISKISLMTGVHRKDVTRIEHSDLKVPTEKSIIARVMAQWQLDSRFATKSKGPRALECEGKQSEFSELVRSVNGENLSAYSVLNEMIRIGAVKKDGQHAKLEWRDYVVSEDTAEGFKLLASDISDLSQAVEANMFENLSVKNLHLKTEFDSISPDFLPEIRKWLLEKGSDFHKSVREYLSKYDCDLNRRLPRHGVRCRVSVGAFSFCTYTSNKTKNNEFS